MNSTLTALATPLSPVLVSITNQYPEARPSGVLTAYEPSSNMPTYRSPYTNSDGSLNGTGLVIGAVSTASMAASAYHGYKRNQSVGWALWWGLMGATFPVITPVIAVAQGFAKPEGK